VLLVVAASAGVALLVTRSDEPTPGRGGAESAPEPQAAIVGRAITGLPRDASDMTFYKGLVWVTSYADRAVFVVDPRSGEVVDRVAVPYSGMARIEPGLGGLWLDGSTGTVARIDAQTHQVDEIDLPSPEESRGSYAIGDHTVWTAAYDSATVVAIDPIDLTAVGQRQYPAAIHEVTAGSGMLFVLDARGTLRFVDEGSGDVVGKLRVGSKWSGAEYEDGVIYVTAGDDDESVTPVAVETQEAGAPISLGTGVGYWEVADGRIWVAYEDDRLVRQFDVSSGDELGDAVLTPGKPVIINIDASGHVWTMLKNGKLLQISPDGSDRPVVSRETVTEEPTAEAPVEPPGAAEPAFTEHAQISIWWSGGDVNSDYAYAHFKAVGGDGETITEIRGSVSVDLEENLDTLQETSELRALADRLRSKLESAGWTELGVVNGGEWYEYEFGR
jgi:streptogramin lyase